jgi:hypothetical protein
MIAEYWLFVRQDCLSILALGNRPANVRQQVCSGAEFGRVGRTRVALLDPGGDALNNRGEPEQAERKIVAPAFGALKSRAVVVLLQIGGLRSWTRRALSAGLRSGPATTGPRRSGPGHAP